MQNVVCNYDDCVIGCIVCFFVILSDKACGDHNNKNVVLGNELDKVFPWDYYFYDQCPRLQLLIMDSLRCHIPVNTVEDMIQGRIELIPQLAITFENAFLIFLIILQNYVILSTRYYLLFAII